MLNDSKLGYYLVGNQRLASKIDACILGSQLNVSPTWHFNDGAWNSVNWSHAPDTNITELYRLRAKQIREQYDYVAIQYSAGSDSQTVVDSFLDAGLFIDEIITVWNREQTAKVVVNPSATDPRNVEAEFELTTRPGLNKIIERSPHTKITYLDVSTATVNTLKTFDGEEWLQNTVEFLHPQYVTRWSMTREKEQLKTLDRGLKTAVVFGVDKPRVTIKDGKYYVYFVDTIINSFRGGFNRQEYNNLDHVLFYWTPDMPEIVVKQAHMIKQWFEFNAALKPIIAWPNHDYAKRSAYEIITRSIIYPNWDLGTFQCAKPTSSVTCEWDDWFFKAYQGSTIYDNWHKGVQHVENSIDKKYLKYNFDNKFDGLVGMINGFFCLSQDQ
jgi:hypothetical protein